MSRDFFMVPWEDPLTTTYPMATTNWWPTRRGGRRGGGYLTNLDGLWNEAMREMEVMQNALDQGFGRGGGWTTTDLGPWQSSIESQVEGKEGEGSKYHMNIHLGRNIRPEDLKVSLKDENGLKVMSVDVKKEQKTENSRIYQEFHRKFTLPENVDMHQIKSHLHPDGFLRIEAPLSQLAIKDEKPKQIPIEMAKVG